MYCNLEHAKSNIWYIYISKFEEMLRTLFYRTQDFKSSPYTYKINALVFGIFGGKWRSRHINGYTGTYLPSDPPFEGDKRVVCPRAREKLSDFN